MTDADTGYSGDPNAAPSPEPTQTGSNGSAPIAEGMQPPPTVAPDPVDTNAVFRKGYADGMRIREARILEELGVSSFDDVRTALSALQAQPAEQEGPQQDDQKAVDKLVRTLKAERRELQQALDVKAADLQRYQSQANRALSSDIKAKLLSAGAHGEGVGDLAALLAPNLAWSRDGTEIEVVEDGPDGHPMPSRLSLEDLIEEQKAKRAWFFKSAAKSGAGSQPDSAQGPEASPQGYDFKRAFDERNRRSR